MPWLDVNRNGVCEPGIDAVDLDHDGKASAHETLRLLESHAFNWAAKEILSEESGIFTPDRDWLCLDTNGNGQRDYGPQAGFDDTTPTFGEPLFLADDLNRNGQLDLEEKLVALGSSKLKATMMGETVRERDKDLSLTEIVDPQLVGHGTGTSGIMAGGNRGYQRWVGLAPDADLLMTSPLGDTSLSSQLIWLVQSKATVVLHEYVMFTGFHLDGSSSYEGLMDQVSAQGVVQVNPAGNLGGSNHHMRVSVSPGSSVTMPIQVWSSPGEDQSSLFLTLLWRSPAVNFTVTLKDPSGHVNAIPSIMAQEQSWGDGKTYYFSYREDSSRGTAMRNIYLYTAQATEAISAGIWELTVQHTSGGSAVLLLGNLDGSAMAFTQNVSELGLICYPATADSAVTVAAYAGHEGLDYWFDEDKSGVLRYYSSRGIRVDGAPIMDIGAPDNPVTPTSTVDGLGTYGVFSGTSGAGPHVAAVALLIQQAHPVLDREGVRLAIHQGALVDEQVEGPIPSPDWGYGKRGGALAPAPGAR